MLTDAAGNDVTEQLTQDPEASFFNLAAGTKLTVTVAARNDAGESQPSAPVTAVVA